MRTQAWSIDQVVCAPPSSLHRTEALFRRGFCCFRRWCGWAGGTACGCFGPGAVLAPRPPTASGRSPSCEWSPSTGRAAATSGGDARCVSRAQISARHWRACPMRPRRSSDALPDDRRRSPALLDALGLVVPRLPPEDRDVLRGWRLPVDRRGRGLGASGRFDAARTRPNGFVYACSCGRSCEPGDSRCRVVSRPRAAAGSSAGRGGPL